MFDLLKDLFGFAKKGKNPWILPLVLVLMLLGVLVVLGHGSVVAPFIYTLF